MGTPAGKTTDAPEVSPRGFAGLLAVANLGLWMPLIPPVLVTLQLRLEDLDPANKERNAGIVLGIGAFLALVGNPLAGRLSDRTASRFGRRRPWLICGMAGGTAGLAVVALVPSLPAILLGWCLAQLSFNATLAALAATIPDQVPVERRGSMSGILGFSQIIAIAAGVGIVASVPGIAAKFLVPAVLGTVLVTAFALLLPDRRLAEPAAPFSLREFAGTFWVNPRNHPDFGYAWLTRFLVSFGVFAPLTYLAFFLPDRVGIAEDDVDRTVALLVVIGLGCTAITSVLGGWLSDRAGRRKPFVIGSGAVLAAGTGLLAPATSLPQVIAAQIVLGIAGGMFLAVDMALITQVLPDPETMAKDLGVINIANTLPQSLAPAAAPLFLAIGDGTNYPAFYGFAALCALAGAVFVTRIKSVR
ncbi:MFS transporter [Actinomadura rudentiformis]|uniref:MFS transporter n=1 Tax=Actinomadura rudentiformis TaxID=359158 RepID=A0A6H9YFF5_9ACTN|nr:MFS transporter [Actinomadura rudentiformis]KAB2342494.1 MFS transporter [Actinomadura rudentiformis]